MKDQHVLILFPLVMILIIFVGLFMSTPEDAESTINFITSFFRDLILKPSITGYTTIGTSCPQTISTSGDYELSGGITCDDITSDAINITVNDVNLNCYPYSINQSGLGVGLGTGIEIVGTNVRLYGCNISKFNINVKIQKNDTVIVDSKTEAGTNDIKVCAGCRNNTAINTTFTTTSIGAAGNLTIQYYLDVLVQDGSGNPVQSASVEAWNITATNNSLGATFTATTGSNGKIPNRWNATSYIDLAGANDQFYSIFTVNATKLGTATQTYINLTTNTLVTLTLTNFPPNVTNLTLPYNNTNTSSLPVNFNFTVYDDYNVSNCTFYTNISSLNATLNITYMGTNNSKEYNISFSSIPDGLYIWNIYCLDNATKADWSNWNNTVLIDTKAPLIYLESPADSLSTTTLSQTFGYNATDNHSDVNNCSLILGSSIDQTISTITESTTQSFTKTLTVGTYTWSVNCTDYQAHIGNSSSRTLTISQSGGGEPSGGGKKEKEEEKPEPEPEITKTTETSTTEEVQKPITELPTTPPNKPKPKISVEEIAVPVAVSTVVVVGIAVIWPWLLLLLLPFLFLRFRHYYIAIIDLDNILKLDNKKRLKEFINLLSKNLNGEIIGKINNLKYQKFNFKNGYMDLLLEEPLTLVAHFNKRKRAELTCDALKQTFQKIIPSDVKTKIIFINSIKVEQEHEFLIKRLLLLIRYMFKRQSKVKQFTKIKLSKDLSTNITQIGNFYNALDYLMKLIERKFKEKIWYIGYDFVDKPTENFIFDKGGNLKVVFDKKVKIEADVPKEKLLKLKNAINFAIKRMLPKNILIKSLFNINVRGY